MRPRLPLLALPLALSVLLAGCASHGHEGDGHHGGDGAPMERGVIVGVENKAAFELAVAAVITDANGTAAWRENFTAGPGALPEKHTALNGTQVYTLTVTWTWTEGGQPREARATDTLDVAGCKGLSHLTFIVSSKGEHEDTHEECHE